MNIRLVVLLTALVLVSSGFISKNRLTEEDPWKSTQLMAPQVLADLLARPKGEQPLVISVGPAASIPGSIEVGPTNEKENLLALEKLVSQEPKGRRIILYCGCCPFGKCPNIPPAFQLLNQLGFTEHQLLDLPRNLKADWIDKGYPTQK